MTCDRPGSLTVMPLSLLSRSRSRSRNSISLSLSILSLISNRSLSILSLSNLSRSDISNLSLSNFSLSNFSRSDMMRRCSSYLSPMGRSGLYSAAGPCSSRRGYMSGCAGLPMSICREGGG